MFVLFINDITSCVSKDTNILLYADDTKIWRRINYDHDSIALQNDIESLNNWAIRNKMKFHPSKCKVLSITNEHVQWILPFDRYPYTLSNIAIDYVTSQKDLGVHVTNTLNWSLHCKTLAVKATNMLNLVKRTCHFTKNKDQKRVLYLTLVRSQFEHCSVVWTPQNVTLLTQVESVQRLSLIHISEPTRPY